MQQGHPLAFINKALGPKYRGLSTYEKEYLTILIAVDQWRTYLQLAEFTIFTDQKSLTHLTDQRLYTHWQQKVFTKLIGLQYQIVYKKGCDNRVAYALSRHPFPLDQLLVMSVCTPVWLDKVQERYAKDIQAQQLLTVLTVAPQSMQHYTLTNGIICYKNMVYIGNNSPLQQRILQALHASAIGGHSGFPMTYRKLKHLFTWKGMKKMTHSFVQSCHICQQAKPNRAKYPGLLSPLANS
jgi:hypothetical protein